VNIKKINKYSMFLNVVIKEWKQLVRDPLELLTPILIGIIITLIGIFVVPYEKIYPQETNYSLLNPYNLITMILFFNLIVIGSMFIEMSWHQEEKYNTFHLLVLSEAKEIIYWAKSATLGIILWLINCLIFLILIISFPIQLNINYFFILFYLQKNL